ncbi:MAG: hypothetical protein CMF26_04655 [Kiloniella sp.]|nr:hypothetical protein [Kiloniella sp.]
MNARRIIALVLGVAAALSLLAKFGLLRAIGLDDFPFWLIWPLTITGLAGAILLWFSPAAHANETAAGSLDEDTAQALATRDARIASLEVELAQIKMAAQDRG